MGNTPSNQASPARGGDRHAGGGGGSSRQPNLRLPMPQRPTHMSPTSSNPASPSGTRGTSPRRRKSLELPDLNKLAFTPAAPVPTLATHTSHHLAPSTTAGHVKRGSTGSAPIPSTAPGGQSSPGRWRQALGGGGRASPLAGMGAMSRLDSVPGPRTAPVTMPYASVSPTRTSEGTVNPYFPTSPIQPASPATAVPIAIPGKEPPTSPTRNEEAHHRGTEPPPPTVASSPPRLGKDATEMDREPHDGLVNVPIQWNGGGKSVFVTGNFADNWKGRIKLKKRYVHSSTWLTSSTHDFNAVLRLPPGQYRLKFIVDDSWRCSKQIATATDDDGTLVNWVEVEAPKTEDELRAEWAMDAKLTAKNEDGEYTAESFLTPADEAQWTSVIPAPLVAYQYLEELPSVFTKAQWVQHTSAFPHITPVPQPPVLPRILDKVILNSEPRKTWDEVSSMSSATPAGLDDNSILAVPNHVVLNHLTASAIKNGTLGVGTTTRYRQKVRRCRLWLLTRSTLRPCISNPRWGI